MQIRAKITLQFVAIVSSLLLVSFLIIYGFSNYVRSNEFYHHLRNKAITTAELLIKVREVDSSLLKIIDRSRKDNFSLENISVYNLSNEELYTNNDTLDFKKILPGFQAFMSNVKSNGGYRTSSGEMEIVGAVYRHRGEEFIVLGGAIDRQGLDFMNSLKNMLIVIFFSLQLFVGVAGWLFAGRALAPISKVVDKVNQLSEDNLSIRLDEGIGEDELERLSMTFNKMLDRVQNAFRLQQTFIANASHELLNPLTKMTAQLEIGLLKERDNDTYKDIISSVLDDVKKMNKVSLSLIQLAQLKNSGSDVRSDLIRIDDLIWELKDEFLKLHSHYKVNYHVGQLPEDERQLLVYGNLELLKTCFQNLMENGCKFSADHTVSVSLKADPKLIEVKFTNTGSGIAAKDLPFVFEPFYRSENSGGIAGHGIGLSLVKLIVLQHGGQIAVTSERQGQTTFTLYLPVAKI